MNIHSEIRLFADDILLHRPIKTSHDHNISSSRSVPVDRLAVDMRYIGFLFLSCLPKCILSEAR